MYPNELLAAKPLAKRKADLRKPLSVLFSAILLSFAFAVSAPADVADAATSSKILNVPTYLQGKSNHCWAAGAQMAAKFVKGSSPNQCSIVNATLGGTSCTNSTATVSQVTSALTNAGLSSSLANGMLTSSANRAELNANRPWLYGYTYNSGSSGHIVVVVGYVYEVIAGVTVDTVYWNDPATGTRKVGSYGYLKSNTSWTAAKSWKGLS